MIFRILPFIFFISGLCAQIPNASLEDWTDTEIFEDLDRYVTSNVEIFYRTTPLTATRVAGADGNALRLETSTTALGKMTNGNFFVDGSGGMAYSDQPDSVKAVVRYDVPLGERATIRVEFSKGGTLVAFGQISLEGTEGNFVTVAAPISQFTDAPDLVNLVIKSSDVLAAGSYVEVDHLEFTGGVAQLPNNDFENWSDLNIEDPEFWITYNVGNLIFKQESCVKRTTDAFVGTYAMEISPQIHYLFGGPQRNSLMQTMGITPDRALLPLDFNPEKFRLHYKYSTPETDSAVVAVSFFRVNDMTGALEQMGTIFDFIHPSADYDVFELDIDFAMQPDSFGIIMAADADEAFNSIPEEGRVLIVDNFVLDFNTSLVNNGYEEVMAYPNPTSSWVNLDLSAFEGREYEVRLLNGLGQQVGQWKKSDEQLNMDLGSYEGGTYTILVQSGDRKVYTTIVKQ